ncbi:MAG: hypothetical protein K2N63_16410 [Lachnospiraceae bacterium]|nr:hypothetical protein [Lachnospiraceae bacterium]
MSRRKIVFVIVEGPSDDEALGVILSRLYDKNVVHVEITHGDITSAKNVCPENIAGRIGNLLRGYAQANHYKAADFREVIHLIDMDGTYVPEDAVHFDQTAEKVVYTTTEILTANPESILARNRAKSGNIDRICFMGKIWNEVPYHAYYMSANLDHVLYDKLNSTDKEKERDACAFVLRYRGQLDEFLSFLMDSDFSVCGDFRESWEFIKKGKHSLERHTNLGICMKQIREERGVAKAGLV